MSKNKDNISVGGLAVHFNQLEKEVTNLGSDLFNIMKMFQDMQARYDLILMKLLKEKDLEEVFEINYTDEEFQDLFAPLIPGVFIKKDTGDFIRVTSIYVGYEFNREKSMEAKKFIFTKDEQEFVFDVGSIQEAYMELKKVIRENNSLIIEE